MKKLLIGVVTAAAGLATALAPTANASGNVVVHGGCSFNSDSQATVTQPDQYDGVIADQSVTTDDATPPNLVHATVGCAIAVNGGIVGSTITYFSDLPGTTGIQAGQAQITFHATATDTTQLCQNVNGGAWDCREAMSLQIPPDQVIAALNTVFDTLTALQIQYTDPLVCAQLKAHPGTYGVVTINAEGDVFGPDPANLGLNPYFDCPPYQTV